MTFDKTKLDEQILIQNNLRDSIYFPKPTWAYRQRYDVYTMLH